MTEVRRISQRSRTSTRRSCWPVLQRLLKRIRLLQRTSYPFWLKEDLRIAIQKIPEFAIKFLNADPEAIIGEVISRNIVKELKLVPIARSNEWVIETTDNGSKMTKSEIRTEEINQLLDHHA